MKAVIVVPSIRENSVREFLAAWEPEFRPQEVIVVEDNARRSFALPEWVTHVSHEEITADLGRDAWIIPRKSGAIRNYGMLLAGRRKPDMIVMLDDDCLPILSTTPYGNGFLNEHWNVLRREGSRDPFYDTIATLQIDTKARGYPKELNKIKTVVNHGLWNNVPDFDGETQLRIPLFRSNFPHHSIQIPRGTLFPLSAMNVAFRPAALPAMYQIPMGQGTPYHRFDDIWCGWIMKKALDHVGLAVRSGSPFIWHARASDAKRNAELEAPGILENERVWRRVMDAKLSTDTLDGALSEIHRSLEILGDYWKRTAEAAAIWRSLCRA